MIVTESDVLTAALDQRMQVDRVLPPAAAMTTGSDGPRADLQQPTAAVRAGANAQQFPLGQRIDVRVVGVGQPGQVIVELGVLRIALAWPSAVPAVGSQVALRVLANTPALLFERVAVDEDATADAPTRLSLAARALQTTGEEADVVTRFSVPILKLEVAATSARSDSAVPDEVVASRAPIVDRPQDPGLVVPLVLHGPAWPGQEVELVVHREREDDQFDNAALDRWCGELVIDLPNLGRVAGHLAWSMQGLRIRLEGQDGASVAAMSAGASELAHALADVDLPVLALSVGQPYPEKGGIEPP